MKNRLEGINSRLGGIEEYLSDLEDRIMKICNQNSKNKNRLKIENSLRDLWDNIKCTNIHIISARKRREREKSQKCI